MSNASKSPRMGKIYFSRMRAEDLEEHAQQGYMRAQFYLGQLYAEKKFPFNHLDEDECLDQAEKWLRLAFDNDGKNLGETKVMAGYKDVKEDVKQLLGDVYWRQVLRNSWYSDESTPEPFTPKAQTAMWAGLEIEDEVLEIKAAYFYLMGQLQNIGAEARSKAESRKHAFSLLIKNIMKDDSSAHMHLVDCVTKTKELDIRAVYGESAVRSGYHKKDILTGQRQIIEGFQLLEKVGDFKVNGFEGYKAAKDALKSLEVFIQGELEGASSEPKKSRAKKAGLSSGFGSKAEDGIFPANSLLEQIAQVRATIERSKQDSDFEPDEDMPR